jgi:DNA-binding HxlR family transcriptional regulator
LLGQAIEEARTVPDGDAPCALLRAVEAMGERWSFRILRAAFNGIQHFEDFMQDLGIARNILANRLTRLVDHGIMVREIVAEDRRKVRYQLTDKGADLLPVIIALREWGERWGGGHIPPQKPGGARDRQPSALPR